MGDLLRLRYLNSKFPFGTPNTFLRGLDYKGLDPDFV